MAHHTLVHSSHSFRRSADCKRVLRLTRSEYREFAEQTKAVGLGLNVSTYTRMGCWGAYSPWALSVVNDTSDEASSFDERAVITIASSINPDRFRAAGSGRPELDWSVLQDNEIYPFLVQHEIGHRQDNFDTIDVHVAAQRLDGPRDLQPLHRRLRIVNEVLADRYAWNQIRPGEPIPLSDKGERTKLEIAEAIAWLDQHFKRLTPCRPERRMRSGSYRDVPDYMLATPARAAFIGVHVNPRLLEKRTAYYQDYNKRCPNNPLF